MKSIPTIRLRPKDFIYALVSVFLGGYVNLILPVSIRNGREP